MLWRQENGREQGFGALRASWPIVAVGAEDPLENQKMLADYFRMYIYPDHTIKLTDTDGRDGLGGIHASV